MPAGVAPAPRQTSTIPVGTSISTTVPAAPRTGTTVASSPSANVLIRRPPIVSGSGKGRSGGRPAPSSVTSHPQAPGGQSRDAQLDEALLHPVEGVVEGVGQDLRQEHRDARGGLQVHLDGLDELQVAHAGPAFLVRHGGGDPPDQRAQIDALRPVGAAAVAGIALPVRQHERFVDHLQAVEPPVHGREGPRLAQVADIADVGQHHRQVLAHPRAQVAQHLARGGVLALAVGQLLLDAQEVDHLVAGIQDRRDDQAVQERAPRGGVVHEVDAQVLGTLDGGSDAVHLCLAGLLALRNRQLRPITAERA